MVPAARCLAGPSATAHLSGDGCMGAGDPGGNGRIRDRWRHATNTLTVPYAGAALLTDIRTDALVSLAFEGWDDDGIGDDPLGACSRPVSATAFSEAVQSTTCPRDAAASQSGFTFRWHLERF